MSEKTQQTERLNPLESGSAFGPRDGRRDRRRYVLIPSKAGLPSDRLGSKKGEFWDWS